MPRLPQNVRLTIPEAAYVADVSERAINHEIDAKVMRVRRRGGGRVVTAADVVYLKAVRDVRHQIAPRLRRRIREAVSAAFAKAEPVAKVAAFEVPIARIERELSGGLKAIEHMRESRIESRSEVLAGEPVIRGTRIAARLVADLLRQGASIEELQNEYDLARDQIEAAALFDRVTPKRGRPSARKLRPTRHVPSDR